MATTNTSNQQPTPSGMGRMGAPNPNTGGNRWILYLIAVVALIVLVVLAYLLVSSVSSPSSGGSTPVVTQNQSANTTPDYMSAAQVQGLLGAQVSNYYNADLFNPNSPINISDLEYVAPALYGNVTSGWISSGSVVNSTYNISLQYYVLKTGNQQAIDQQLSSVIASSMNMTPTIVNPGVYNGLTYSYSLYTNSTSSFQLLTGWKGNNVVLLLLQSYPPFVANEMQFIALAANDTT